MTNIIGCRIRIPPPTSRFVRPRLKMWFYRPRTTDPGRSARSIWPAHFGWSIPKRFIFTKVNNIMCIASTLKRTSHRLQPSRWITIPSRSAKQRSKSWLCPHKARFLLPLARSEMRSAKKAGARSRSQPKSLVSKSCAGSPARISAKNHSIYPPPTCKPQVIGFPFRKRWSRHCASAEPGPTTRTIMDPTGRASVLQSGRGMDSAARSAEHPRMDASMTCTTRSPFVRSSMNMLRILWNSCWNP